MIRYSQTSNKEKPDRFRHYRDSLMVRIQPAANHAHLAGRLNLCYSYLFVSK